MKNKISDLNDHLFEVIEMLKNNSDPNADETEKMDLETAKRISEVGKVIIEGAKVQVQALELIANAANPDATINSMERIGIINKNEQKAIL